MFLLYHFGLTINIFGTTRCLFFVFIRYDCLLLVVSTGKTGMLLENFPSFSFAYVPMLVDKFFRLMCQLFYSSRTIEYFQNERFKCLSQQLQYNKYAKLIVSKNGNFCQNFSKQFCLSKTPGVQNEQIITSGFHLCFRHYILWHVFSNILGRKIRVFASNQVSVPEKSIVGQTEVIFFQRLIFSRAGVATPC